MNRSRFKDLQRIAQESARILVEEGIEDYQLAKQKAAKRLGYSPRHPLPGNDEIETAVSEFHRLFRSRVQESHIRKLRIIALETMIFLESFSPRLVGNIVDGSAGRHSPIVVYLSADSPEPVVISFLNAGISFNESYRRSTIAGRKLDYPILNCVRDQVKIEIHILARTPFREFFQNRKTGIHFATINGVRDILDSDF